MIVIGGKMVYGVFVGILMFEVCFLCIFGDMGNV